MKPRAILGIGPGKDLAAVDFIKAREIIRAETFDAIKFAQTKMAMRYDAKHRIPDLAGEVYLKLSAPSTLVVVTSTTSKSSTSVAQTAMDPNYATPKGTRVRIEEITEEDVSISYRDPIEKINRKIYDPAQTNGGTKFKCK